MTAFAKGAAAVMLYNPDPSPAGGTFMMDGMGGRGGDALDPAAFTRPFLAATSIDDTVFRWIMWRDPQETARGFSARFAALRADIKAKKARSAATGVVASLKGYDAVTRYGEQHKNNSSRNVIAKIEGTDPSLKAQYVIAGGHFDHTGVTNGVVFNGADDNASGAATVMEVARALAAGKAQPKRTLIFALWTGEEEGLIGSQYYSDNPTDGVKMDATVAYFNMHMVGLGDRIGAPGALNVPSIFEVIMRDQDPEIAKRVDPSQSGPGGSDHSAFIERGIEALALMTSGRGGHPDYHDSGDDAAKMEADILGWTGQFVLQGMLNLASDTSVSLLIPDRLVQYQSQRYAPPDVSGASLGEAVRAGDDARRVDGTGGAAGQGGRGAAGRRHQGDGHARRRGRRARRHRRPWRGRVPGQRGHARGRGGGAELRPRRRDGAGRRVVRRQADGRRDGGARGDGGERDRPQPRAAGRGPALRRARPREEADHGDRAAAHGRGGPGGGAPTSLSRFGGATAGRPF